MATGHRLAGDAIRSAEVETTLAGGGPAEAGRDAAAAIELLADPAVIGPPVHRIPGRVAPATARRSVWRHRDFRILLAGQGVSAFGDAISSTALPLLVVLLTGSGFAMGAVGILQTLPDLLLGLPAGALADRWDRRRMMLWADAGRAALTALVPLSFALDLPTMAIVVAVTFPINALRVLFMAGWSAAIPNLVDRDEVGQANGYAEALLSASFVVGPAIAGVLVSVVGPGPTLAIDALSFAVSAASLSLIRRPLQQARERPETHLLADIRDGVRFIMRQPTLRIAIAFWGVRSVIGAPIVVAVIYTLTVDRDQPSEVVGAVLSLYGLGYLVGAIVAGRLSRRPLGPLMLGANVVASLVIAAFALVALVPVMLAGALVVGFSEAIVLISYITLRSTIPPDELLGRVGSVARMISIGMAPIGLLIGGILLDAVSGSWTMVVIGLAMLLATAVFATSATLRHAAAPVRPSAAT